MANIYLGALLQEAPASEQVSKAKELSSTAQEPMPQPKEESSAMIQSKPDPESTSTTVKRKIAYAKAPQRLADDSDNIESADSGSRRPQTAVGELFLIIYLQFT